MSASITAAASSGTNSTSIATSIATTVSSESLPNFGATISGYFQAFAGQLHILAAGIDGAATLIAFYAGLILIPIGAILYWSHISRRTGWGMFIGGIILIALSYMVFPNLSSIAPP